MGVSIRAARVSTLGAEAVDVFYVVDGSGERLDDPRIVLLPFVLVVGLLRDLTCGREGGDDFCLRG